MINIEIENLKEKLITTYTNDDKEIIKKIQMKINEKKKEERTKFKNN